MIINKEVVYESNLDVPGLLIGTKSRDLQILTRIFKITEERPLFWLFGPKKIKITYKLWQNIPYIENPTMEHEKIANKILQVKAAEEKGQAEAFKETLH